MSEDIESFSKRVSRLGYELAGVMDRMKKQLKLQHNEVTEKALRSMVRAQGEILKAYFWLDARERSYTVPPDAQESWEHFVAKNEMICRLEPQSVVAECSYGEMRFDAIAKVKEEYVVVEAETKSRACIKKFERIRRTINALVSGGEDALDKDCTPVLAEIQKLLRDGKPLRVVFALTKSPNEIIVKTLLQAGNSQLIPELYYVNPIPDQLTVSPINI